MEPQPCPSTGAYRRHLRNGENPKELDCGCLEVHNERQRQLYATRHQSKPRKLQPCPSPAAYRRHRKDGATPDEMTCGCPEAFRADERARHARRRAQWDAGQ